MAKDLPAGLNLVGDNAYSNSNMLLTPFTKSQTTTSSRDSFNFLLNQLRIRVEIAFGLLVNKWRVFKSPLMARVKNATKVVRVACILHIGVSTSASRTATRWRTTTIRLRL